jgi:hypothetical protein
LLAAMGAAGRQVVWEARPGFRGFGRIAPAAAVVAGPAVCCEHNGLLVKPRL